VRPDLGRKLKLESSSFRTNLFEQQAGILKPTSASWEAQAGSSKLPDS
jgi:hypothetical protein